MFSGTTPILKMEDGMTQDQEIRAKALELAIRTFDEHLDLFGMKLKQEHATNPDNVLFEWADSIAQYLQKPL
jgi:hypothetical protein